MTDSKVHPVPDTTHDPARSMPTWAVVGASGFVGSALVDQLRLFGHSVIEIKAPRLTSAASGFAATPPELDELESTISDLRDRLSESDIVVNAAGMALPGARPSIELTGANALLPVVLLEAAKRAEVARFIQLSSAAVQGNIKQLDSTETVCPFSPYSESKALGERWLRHVTLSSTECVIVRATSVQGPNRSTTTRLRRFARSPFSSVASPPDQPSPVSSINGLINCLIKTGQAQQLPPIVLQPWEGGTVASILELAGDGKRPVVLPRWMCRSLIALGYAATRALRGKFAGAVRRIELMWFGQVQEDQTSIDAEPSDGLRAALSSET